MPILLLFVLWLPVPSFANTPKIVNELLAKQDYQNALKQANAGLQQTPENTRLMLQKGFIMIKLRQLAEAEQFYLSVIGKIPDNPEPMNNLGVVYQLKREYGKAISQFNATIERFPNFSRAYENLGDTYIQIATINYQNGLSKSPEEQLLISKADLSQRFYDLARRNVEDAVSRFNQTSGGATKGSSSEESVTKSKSLSLEQEVADFLRSWVVAWSSRNNEAYFAHYGENFKPSEGQSQSIWKNRKTQILAAAEFINIRIEGIKFLEVQDNKINIAFTQNYESNTYKSESRKELTLGRYENGLLIDKEV